MNLIEIMIKNSLEKVFDPFDVLKSHAWMVLFQIMIKQGNIRQYLERLLHGPIKQYLSRIED